VEKAPLTVLSNLTSLELSLPSWLASN